MALKWPFVGDTGKETLFIHCSGLLEDRASSWCDSFSRKMVLKRLFVSDSGKPHLCMVIYQVSGRQLQAILLGDTASSSYSSLSGKMVFKRPFFGDTGEAFAHSLFKSQTDRASSSFSSFSGNVVSNRLFLGDNGEASALQIHCLSLVETELQAILLGDRTLNWYDRFSRKIVLKRPFLSDTGEACADLFRFLGDRALSHFPGRQNFKLMLQFVGKISWKGYFSVTLGKPCLSTFIDQVPGRQSIEPISWEAELWFDIIVSSGKIILRRPFLL